MKANRQASVPSSSGNGAGQLVPGGFLVLVAGLAGFFA
jgi:hypothetical protein